MGHSNCDQCGHDTKMCECEEHMTDHYAGSASVRNQEANGGSVRQVGGDHYQAKYQHWDWVADARVGYFEANATKYMSRWWKKGGAQDIEKSYSYVKKMYSLLAEHRYVNTSHHVSPYSQDRWKAEHSLVDFFKSADIPPNEKGIIHAIANWRSDVDLLLIMREIDMLYMDASAGATLATIAAAATTPTTTKTTASGPGLGSSGGTCHPAPFGYQGDDGA